MKADFAIYNSQDQPLALLEIKAVRNVDATWAAKYRRNLLEHLGPVPPGYFGIVTPTTLFLWRDRDELSEVPPDYEVDLQAYTSQFPETALRGNAFEFVVSSLLREIASGAANDWPGLAQSGFADVLKSGRVSYEAAA